MQITIELTNFLIVALETIKNILSFLPDCASILIEKMHF